jgi:poly-beta-1,6-N-acetyl-D-glucosamine synthase
MPITCSVGVFAHNEAANILHLLEAIRSQKLSDVCISEVIVVSSASTDGTDDLVQDFAAQNPKFRLITQEKREGKSNAINLFIKEAVSDILVVISADVLPSPETLELLVSAFGDPQIGATGGRPFPINNDGSFMAYAVQLLWRLHHRMALISPKLGEMIAFRKVMDAIPGESAVDEASIESMVRAAGYKLRYIPEALIYNKGPENFGDFVKQRRRIQNGHLWLSQNQHYQVVSQNKSTLLKILWQELASRPRDAFKLLMVVLLESYCRALGSWDYHIKKKNPFAWEIAGSTKRVKQ